jgi:taurine dioxygenase
MPLSLRPMHPTFGVEVLGFDPREPFTEATRRELYGLLLTHRLLLFRDAPLDEEQQARLTQVAGVLTFRGAGHYSDPGKKSSLVSNVHEEGLFGNGELSFHSDLSFTPTILKARSLHALLLPTSPQAGGQTLFCDVQAACQELPPELRARAEPLKARFAATYDYGDHQETLDFIRSLLDVHPITGQRFIAASRAVTKEVIGMPREEFRPLLKAIWAHMEQPRYVYRHDWRLGDTLLWDNVGTQHARTPFDAREQRALRAVSVDEPAVAQAAARDHALRQQQSAQSLH